MRINHAEQHPVLHASLQESRETREARIRQLARLDELQAQLAQLPTDSPEVESTRREAVKVLNQLYEETKSSHWSCKISSWYYQTSVALGAPPSWTPVSKADLLGKDNDSPEARLAFWRLFRGE